MAKNFDDLANRAKADWSEKAARVYDAAAVEFAAEISERAEPGAVLAAAAQGPLPHTARTVRNQWSATG